MRIGHRKHTQVNCEDRDCYYNDPNTNTCKRSGIHASKKSCYCYLKD